MARKIIAFFTSLRLTVVLLCLAVVLVFVGTLGQVDEGLYTAQSRFFRSLLVYWSPKGVGWRIPVFPGGYLIGSVLLLNLVAAHIKRFSFSRKKIGILLVHSGLILLLLGQLFTDLLAVESHMRLTAGETKDYSESSLHNELAIINTSDPRHSDVVVIPEELLARRREFRLAQLPFTLRVKSYLPNSEPSLRAPMVDRDPPQATRGIADRLRFSPKPTTAKMDDRNIPAAVVEVDGGRGPLGTWLLSDWLSDDTLTPLLRRDWGQWLGSALDAPQQFTYRGQTYQLALRPVRYYLPFSLQLLKFSHDVYRGTDIPKNFSSRVRLRRPATGEDREVLIHMNAPLRYGGDTFYQASFDELDPQRTATILQVVRNPGWLTPYFACVLIALGLVIQFGMHLVGFARKRTRASASAPPPRSSARGRRGPTQVPARRQVAAMPTTLNRSGS